MNLSLDYGAIEGSHALKKVFWICTKVAMMKKLLSVMVVSMLMNLY